MNEFGLNIGNYSFNLSEIIKTMSIIMLIALGIALIFYILIAIFLSKLNKLEYGKGTALAWIPICNIYLLGKLAINKAVGWILIVLLFLQSFLPASIGAIISTIYGASVIILFIIAIVKYFKLKKEDKIIRSTPMTPIGQGEQTTSVEPVVTPIVDPAAGITNPAPTGVPIPETVPEMVNPAPVEAPIPETVPEMVNPAPTGAPIPETVPEMVNTAPVEAPIPETVPEMVNPAPTGAPIPETVPEMVNPAPVEAPIPEMVPEIVNPTPVVEEQNLPEMPVVPEVPETPVIPEIPSLDEQTNNQGNN